MKKVAILVAILVGTAFTGFSQENTKEQPQRIKLYPSSHENSNKKTPEQEIVACEQQIEALDTKEEWIKNNPEELKKATENGWFVQAEETRQQLTKKINELKK